MKENRVSAKIKQYLQRLFLAALILFLLPVFPRQQDDDEFIDKKEWRQLTEGEDYTEHSKRWGGCNRSFDSDITHSDPKTNMLFLQIFSYSALVLILAVLIWYLISHQLISIDGIKRRGRNDKVSFEFYEKNLEAIDDQGKLHELLKKAIDQKKYGLAVRIRFVLLIRHMDDRNLLQFSINKTNRHYIQDINTTAVKDDFVRIVRLFERVWYGGREVSEVEYNSINRLFDRFLTQIPIHEK